MRTLRTSFAEHAQQITDFVVAVRDASPMEKSAAITTQAGAAVAIAGGISLSEWAAIVGITVSILSLALNAYVSIRRLKIEENRGGKCD